MFPSKRVLLQDVTQYAEDKDFQVIWAACELKQHTGDFYIDSGFLFQGNRLCITRTSLKEYLIQEYHANGLQAHLGREKTIAALESKILMASVMERYLQRY